MGKLTPQDRYCLQAHRASPKQCGLLQQQSFQQFFRLECGFQFLEARRRTQLHSFPLRVNQTRLH